MAFAKFQTVAWWIKQLKEYPSDAKVTIATADCTNLKMLSTYMGAGKNKDVLWIDVGGKHD